MASYVALLRGINVGGNNPIKMSELRTCFEQLGFGCVRTYIASGNVLFETAAVPSAKLESRIESALARTFAYRASIVLRSHRELQKVVSGAPKGFGEDPARFRYDVIFLKAPLTAALAMKSVELKAGVDRAEKGNGVLYFARLSAKAVQSRLPKLASLPVYQSMTIRNWNTTTKLLSLLDAGKG